MIDRLLAELDEARSAFHDALGNVDSELATVPGVVGDWSVRDIVHHLAVWCEHAVGALDLAAAGHGEAFAYDDGETDAMNERFLIEGRTISAADALAREDAAFARFREHVAALDPALLSLRLGNGDTVEEVIRYDGRDHYAEHTGHIRAWFGGDDDLGDDDDDDV